MAKYYKVHPAYWDYLQLLDTFYDDIFGHMPTDFDDFLSPSESDELARAEERVDRASYKWELIEDE